MGNRLRDTAAIVGIGATPFTGVAPETELQLAARAVTTALADAGLGPSDVDGMATLGMDNNTEIEVARNVGVPSLRFFSRVPYGGGGGCAVIGQAAMAIATGVADVVVCYRALKERSWYRFGAAAGGVAMQNVVGPPVAEAVRYAQYTPYGFMTPAGWAAMFAQRYMYDYGVSSLDFGRVAVAHRAFAATNPAARFFGRPITLDEHQASPLVVDPLRLFDCCMESDGAVALVLTSPARARDLPGGAVLVRSAAQGSGWDQEQMTSYYREEFSTLPEVEIVARELFGSSGLSPDDIDVAILYDHFTPYVLAELEALGFCKPGEARDFVADGSIGPGGSLPVNTHGGQIGEAFLHGLNGITEAVRQVRGTAANQVADVRHVLVAAGAGVPTSGLILGRDD